MQGTGWSDEGVMEMGNGDNVPGVTGHSACVKTVHIVGEVGDDHFNDLLGKPVGRG